MCLSKGFTPAAGPSQSWLLAAGCWLLAAGCWLLAAGWLANPFSSVTTKHNFANSVYVSVCFFVIVSVLQPKYC